MHFPSAHRIARVNYVSRTASFAYSFLVVSALMAERGMSVRVEILAVLTLLAYPHLAYLHARIAVDSKRAEFRNLNADSVLMGMWIAQMQFALWPSCGALLAISLNNAVCGGSKRFLTGMLWCVGGTVIWGALGGYHFQPATETPVTALSVLGILTYAASLGLFLHEQNSRLVRTRNVLRSSEAQFRFIAEHAGGLVVVLDPKGKFRYASASHAAYFSPDAYAEGRDWIDLVHPRDREQARTFLAVLLGARESQRTKLHMIAATGGLLLAECDGNPVHDESGELQMIVLVSRNLGARARAEVDLRLAASAYDRLDDAILICDGAGRIEFINKAYTRLTGYAPGDVVGRSVDATRSGLSSERLFQNILESIGQDQPWQGNYTERCKDGKAVLLSACVFPMRDEHGTMVHAVWTVHGAANAPNEQSA
ncbi:MAG: PAS domain S-box protein [Burkholderiales bacterium]